jgi:hypothetical protein
MGWIDGVERFERALALPILHVRPALQIGAILWHVLHALFRPQLIFRVQLLFCLVEFEIITTRSKRQKRKHALAPKLHTFAAMIITFIIDIKRLTLHLDAIGPNQTPNNDSKQ